MYRKHATVYWRDLLSSMYTEKVFRGHLIFFLLVQKVNRSIKVHDQMNKPMSNSGSVSFYIPKCVIYLTQTKHE